MALKFALEPVDALFFDSARYRYEFLIDLAAPADVVWAGLTEDHPQGWCRMLTKVRFSSPPPRGTGARRRSEVARGVLSFEERFFSWDESTMQHSFYVKTMNVPLLRSFAEELRVVPTPTGSQLRWTFAFQPRPGFATLVRLGLPAITWLLRSLAKDTERAFAGQHIR